MKIMNHKIMILIILVLILIISALTTSYKTNVRLNKDAKEVISYFKNLNRKNQPVVAGQMLGRNNIKIDYHKIMKLKCKPYLLGFDLGGRAISSRTPNLKTALKVALSWQGLITVSWHMINPFTWTGKKKYIYKNIEEGSSKDLLDFDYNFDNVYTVGTRENNILNNELDRVSKSFLLPLKKQGKIILFRPFHECNGSFFWWSVRVENRKKRLNYKRINPVKYAKLYKYIQNYLLEKYNLNNLIYVFNASSYSKKEVRIDFMKYYNLISNNVDMVSMDIYSNHIKFRSIKKLMKLNKPVGLAEYGPNITNGTFSNMQFLNRLNNYFSEISWFMYWNSFDNHKLSILDQKDVDIFLCNKKLITIKGKIK